MFKCALRVVAILAVVAPTALCQTKVSLDSKKVTFMLPTGIFVAPGQTVTINATGTLTLTDPGGSGSFTVNAIGVIQTVTDENTDKSFYDFLRDVALPPGQPPAPGVIKFPPAGTGATLTGAYGALVLGLSPNQCGATSSGDFPHGFINPGTGAGPLPISGGYIYLGVQRDNEVSVSGSYGVSISLSGSASPPLGCTSAMEALDPVPNFLISTGTSTQPSYAITTNQSALTAGGRAVTGVAADGVAQVLIRSRGMDTTHVNFVVLVDENGNVAPGNGEDGTLISPFGGAITSGPAVIPAIQNVNGINYIFVTYQSPIDYSRSFGQDNATSSRKISIVLFDGTSNSVVALASLNLLRPPIFFVHGLWSGPDTWNQFDPALQQAIPGINTFRADYEDHNWDFVANDTPKVIDQAQYALTSFKTVNNAAAAQLDFIVHSMGGLISDTMPTLPAFKVQRNFGQGYIHKLITIDTPYLGSPLATGVDNSSVACKAILIKAGAIPLGAIYDLDPDHSFAKNFNPYPAGFSKHAIASFVTPDQSKTAENWVNGLVVAIQPTIFVVADACYSIFANPAGNAPPGFAFSSYFSSIGDPNKGANDLVVSEDSQLAQYAPGTTADVTSGLAHSNAVIFFKHINILNIPGSLDYGVGSPISNVTVALNLLNSPTLGPLFLRSPQ